VNDNDNEENDENTTKRESKKKFRNAQGNISRVDVESPDLEKYPEFAKATPMDVVLGPGDFIYIPSRTWHYVRSLTASCSLNFLF
jgi:ribosomal protein L16 Arg81 hydroxylase